MQKGYWSMKIIRHWKGILVVVLIIALMKELAYYQDLKQTEENYLKAIESYQDTMCGSQADHLFDKLYAFDAEHGKVMTDDDESDN